MSHEVGGMGYGHGALYFGLLTNSRMTHTLEQVAAVVRVGKLDLDVARREFDE